MRLFRWWGGDASAVIGKRVLGVYVNNRVAGMGVLSGAGEEGGGEEVSMVGLGLVLDRLSNLDLSAGLSRVVEEQSVDHVMVVAPSPEGYPTSVAVGASGRVVNALMDAQVPGEKWSLRPSDLCRSDCGVSGLLVPKNVVPKNLVPRKVAEKGVGVEKGAGVEKGVGLEKVAADVDLMLYSDAEWGAGGWVGLERVAAWQADLDSAARLEVGKPMDVLRERALQTGRRGVGSRRKRVDRVVNPIVAGLHLLSLSRALAHAHTHTHTDAV